jgi:cysteine-rich repeat protein
MTRSVRLLGAVAVVAIGAMTIGVATAAKKPPETSRRCRKALGRNVVNETTVGLRNMSACQRRADAGRPPRADCNQLDNSAGTSYGRAEALTSGQVGDGSTCPPGDPALAIYPGGTTQGLLNALLPAVKRELEASGAVSLGGIPQGVGKGAGSGRVEKCRRAIASAHGTVVRKVLKASLRCQRRIDRTATAFGAIDPDCLEDAGSIGRKMTAKVERACRRVSGAEANACTPLPGCVVQSGEDTAHTLARLSFPSAQVCGNGTIELGEECDDGNVDGGDGCTATCLIPGDSESFCGNGVVEEDEECDEGNAGNQDDGNCTTACRFAVCGDGFVDISQPGVEECDDGNSTPSDGCTNCEIDGTVCAGGALVATVSFFYEPRVTGALGGAFLDVAYKPPLEIPGTGTDRTVRDRLTSLVTVPAVGVRLRDCDAENCTPYLDGTNPVRASLLLTDNSGSSPAQLPTGQIAKIRFDCPDGTLVRVRDLPCRLDQVSDGNMVFPPERLEEEGIRCVVETLEPGQ